MRQLFKTGVVGLALCWAGQTVVAQHCMIEQSACADLRASKNANLVQILRAPAGNAADSAAQKVVYSTFENLAQKAKASCRSKVSAQGFSPLFVLGNGRSKRALMYKGTSECIWVKAK